MKLGMQIGLGPGHIVLDGDPAPLPKGAHPCYGIASGLLVFNIQLYYTAT